MLVLRRNHGERVILDTANGPVVITMVNDEGRWKVAIEAPPSVGIWRSEICPPELLAKVKAAGVGRQ